MPIGVIFHPPSDAQSIHVRKAMNGPCQYGCTVVCLMSFNLSFGSEWLHRHNVCTLIHACTHTDACMHVHTHMHVDLYI